LLFTFYLIIIYQLLFFFFVYRSSHAACQVESRIFVHGGWNAVQQFADLHIFDTTTNTWTEADVSSTSPPCWNHGACAVEAIPNWKLFVFGGCSGELGKYKSEWRAVHRVMEAL
jgi:dynein heavy chain